MGMSTDGRRTAFHVAINTIPWQSKRYSGALGWLRELLSVCIFNYFGVSYGY